MPNIKWIIIGLINIILSACMVGPDFSAPQPPSIKQYTASPLPKKTVSISSSGKAGQAQQFKIAEDIPEKWWILFRSPTLDQLIRAGIKNSPNLIAAKATLRQAQENLTAQFGALLLPNVGLNIGGERQRFSDQQLGFDQSSIFNLYNTTLNISYTFDIWGGARRQLDALAAQVDYEYYQFMGAYLTLTANIVTTSITIASLQAQIDATKTLIAAVEHQLNIMNQQFTLGSISKENILSQQTLLAQTKASLPPLEKNLSQSHHALAVLVGSLPSDLPLPNIKLDELYLPKTLPISLPGHLVQQRPDIQAAEALLRQASAEIGVATANLLPQVSIDGTYGWLSMTLHHFFKPANNIWSYGTQIVQPIFRGGSLLAERRAAIAAYDAAFAQYKQTVLQAFKNVADALRAIETDARAFKAQKQAEIAAKNTLDLTQQQFNLGAVSYLILLNAEQQYQQILINRIQAQAARYNDTAALFQALGGGWWHNPHGAK